MTTALTTVPEEELLPILQSSLYPGAALPSIRLVLGYCKASGLDPMLKPVHIVPMWDSKASTMRDVVMPGVGLYRTTASRTGEYAGVSEPEFGPDVTSNIGGVEITYPTWCKVTVKRRLASGEVCEFTSREFWKENYAVRGGKERSIAPNAMWFKRPYGQIAKCAEAQALRKAFPEVGAQPTADEVEGKTLFDEADVVGDPPAGRKPTVATPQPKARPAQEQAQGDVTDVEPKATPKQEPNGELATSGEIAYITKKIEAKFNGWTVADVFEKAGLSGDTLDGLTKDGFIALRDICK